MAKHKDPATAVEGQATHPCTCTPCCGTLLQLAQSNFIASVMEIQTRIAQRQGVLQAYLAAGILALTPALEIDKVGWISACIPIISVACALLVRHNDAMIGVLAKFCQVSSAKVMASLCVNRLSDTPPPILHARDQEWTREMFRHRKYFDRAFLILFILFSVLGDGIALRWLWVVTANENTSVARVMGTVLAMLLFAVGVWSGFLIHTSQGDRERMHKSTDFDKYMT